MSEPFETIRENLRKTEKFEDAVAVVRKAELSEAVRLLKNCSEKKVCEFFQKAFDRPLISAEMLSLCNEVATRKKSEGKERSFAKIALIKTPLYMTAARKLTGHITTLRMTECHDFRSACEEVSLDRADLCILPVCSSQDGYYPTFAKLIKAYELKIANTCRLMKPDSDEELQFALLAKKLRFSNDAKVCVFSFVEDESISLGDLICAVSGAGGKPYSVTSSPLAYNMDRFEHRIEMRLGTLSPEGVAFFLEAALPSHTLLGIY